MAAGVEEGTMGLIPWTNLMRPAGAMTSAGECTGTQVKSVTEHLRVIGYGTSMILQITAR